VPLIAEIREGGDAGTPIVVTKPDGLAGEVFRGIAETLLARLAKSAA
jgi:ATP-binding protein involved in chromosome partitioning